MSINILDVINPYYRVKHAQKQYLNLKFPKSSGLDPRRYFEQMVASLSPSQMKTLGYLVQLWARFGFICPSQATIGSKADRCSRTIGRHLVELKGLGYVTSLQRYNNSCLYKVNPMLMNAEVRSELSRVCSSFRFIPFLLLLATRDLIGNVRLGLSNIYINKPPEYVSHIEPDRKGGSPMVPSEISSTLKSITCLRLTKWGQIRLACFPDEALLCAQREFIKQKGNIDAPFSWFKSACERYCFEKSIRICHERVHTLWKRFPEPDEARMLLDVVQPDTACQPFSRALESVSQDPVRGWLVNSSPMVRTQVSANMPDDVSRRIAERKLLRGIRS